MIKNEQAYKMIEESGITPEILSELIKNHLSFANEAYQSYQNYLSNDLTIQNRQLLDPNKINEKLNMDFRKLIVNQAIGYAFGVPVTHELTKKDKYDESKIDEINKLIDTFLVQTQAHKKNLETAIYASTGGYAGRYFYYDEELDLVNFSVLPAWQCIFLGDKGYNTQYKYGIVYWKDVSIDGKDITQALFLDAENIYSFTGSDSYTEFTQNEVVKHNFGIMPLIKFRNNPDEKNDFYNVESLINALDYLMSDAQNEIEEQRLAYIILKGDADITQETVMKARQTGVFSIDEDNDIFYLEKSNNDGNMQNQYQRLKESIFLFSQSLDYTDDNFAGSGGSGEARKWKLLPLENKIGIKMTEFSSALMEQWRIVCNFWLSKFRLEVDYFDITNDFTRNLPVDLDYVATYSQKMKGIYSFKTIFAHSPIVDNPEEEIKRIQEEGGLSSSLTDPNFSQTDGLINDNNTETDESFKAKDRFRKQETKNW